MRRDNTTGFVGVSKVGPTTNRDKPYRATYFNNGRKILVGYFKTADEAFVARTAAINNNRQALVV